MGKPREGSARSRSTLGAHFWWFLKVLRRWNQLKSPPRTVCSQRANASDRAGHAWKQRSHDCIAQMPDSHCRFECCFTLRESFGAEPRSDKSERNSHETHKVLVATFWLTSSAKQWTGRSETGQHCFSPYEAVDENTDGMAWSRLSPRFGRTDLQTVPECANPIQNQMGRLLDPLILHRVDPNLQTVPYRLVKCMTEALDYRRCYLWPASTRSL